MAGGKRLDPFGEWGLMDSLAKSYSYSHDEVFSLSWGEVMTMIAYNRELAYIETRASEIKKLAEKKT